MFQLLRRVLRCASQIERSALPPRTVPKQATIRVARCRGFDRWAPFNRASELVGRNCRGWAERELDPLRTSEASIHSRIVRREPPDVNLNWSWTTVRVAWRS